MQLIDQIVKIIEPYAEIVPLPIFVTLGAFVEEVVAPIPSPFIMTGAGSIAAGQERTILYLILLALLGSFGKTLGAWVVYYVSDIAEDVITTKFGKLLGVTHREVEAIGKRFGKGWKDDVTLFILRTLPILPSAPISVVCGIIKLNIRTYLVSTFLGITIRNMIFILFGYFGIESYNHIVKGIENTESIMQVIIFLALGALIAWTYWKRRKETK